MQPSSPCSFCITLPLGLLLHICFQRVRFSFFSTTLSDWLGRTPLKWPAALVSKWKSKLLNSISKLTLFMSALKRFDKKGIGPVEVCAIYFLRRRQSQGVGVGFSLLFVCLFFQMIFQTLMQLGSPNMSCKCSTLGFPRVTSALAAVFLSRCGFLQSCECWLLLKGSLLEHWEDKNLSRQPAHLKKTVLKIHSKIL